MSPTSESMFQPTPTLTPPRIAVVNAMKRIPFMNGSESLPEPPGPAADDRRRLFEPRRSSGSGVDIPDVFVLSKSMSSRLSARGATASMASNLIMLVSRCRHGRAYKDYLKTRLLHSRSRTITTQALQLPKPKLLFLFSAIVISCFCQMLVDVDERQLLPVFSSTTCSISHGFLPSLRRRRRRHPGRARALKSLHSSNMD